MLVIMCAYHYPKKRVSIEDIIAEEKGDVTIIAARREVSWDKETPLFIITSGKDEVALGTHRYTQDTGMGYTNKNKLITVENVIYVNKDGIIAHKLNNVGMDGEKRSPWVFK